MARKEILDQIQKYTHPFRITKGKGFQLKDFDPGDTRGLKLEKSEAADLLQRGTEWLAEEQDILYAQDRWSLLLVFQAMDAAGKDSAIKHVMSGVNPQGCQVFSFKQPSSEDLAHDFMWRYASRFPERGRIGIFNRSYYEEVLVVRVHEEILKRQKLPLPLVGKRIWDERLADIAHIEDYLTRQGTIILKFFLNVSREEQKKRFMRDLTSPRRIGNFRRPTCASASSGTIICTRSRRPSRRPPQNTRHGTWCRPTTSGSPGSSSLRRSWKRSRSSTSLIQRSTHRRRRSWNSRARSSPAERDMVAPTTMSGAAALQLRYALRGGAWAAVYLACVLAPLFALLIGPLPPARDFWTEFSVAVGYSGLAMMGLQFGLTARFRFVTAPWGEDVIYHLHRQISLLAVPSSWPIR